MAQEGRASSAVWWAPRRYRRQLAPHCIGAVGVACPVMWGRRRARSLCGSLPFRPRDSSHRSARGDTMASELDAYADLVAERIAVLGG
jgi:hypothetical protein